MTTAYLTHPASLLHDMGFGHPECPARVSAIENELARNGLLDLLQCHTAIAASKDQLARVHAPEYIDDIFRQSPSRGMTFLDPDTSMNPHTLEASLHAAGAGIQAVDLIMSGQANNAFCNIRPPGHHAGRSMAAGFCIFNNIAVAAAHALHHHGLQRVAIADFDVHHGNGTDDIFNNDSRVMLCSSFRHPYYPYEGTETGNFHIINTPLPAGADGTRFRGVVNEHWLPALEQFKPEFLFISAGFDAHREDSMGGLALSDEDYHWVSRILMSLAAKYACGRVVSMLEGGYALAALGRCATAHVNVLLSSGNASHA